jgi:G3E family GTPase
MGSSSAFLLHRGAGPPPPPSKKKKKAPARAASMTPNATTAPAPHLLLLRVVLVLVLGLPPWRGCSVESSFFLTAFSCSSPLPRHATPRNDRGLAFFRAAPSLSSLSSSKTADGASDAAAAAAAAAAASSSTAASDATTQVVVPMVLLSGFLGTGKTSALQHLLHSPDHKLKLGVIVNDMAAVNVDAKVLSSNYPQQQQQQQQQQGSDSTSNAAPPPPPVVQMQNGCACCSLADELYVSVQQLVQSASSVSPLDAIVVELSGVADPTAIRNNWSVAPPDIRRQAQVQTVVTLVDATTFGTDYLSWEDAQDRTTWNTEVVDESTAHRKVSELLAEQVEAADLLLLNKIDLATPEQIEVATAVASALNDKARIEQVQFGRIGADVLLGLRKGSRPGEPGNDDAAAKASSVDCDDPACSDPSRAHSHSHDHDHRSSTNEAAAAEACADPGCSDPTHAHSHDHHHRDETDESVRACADPECNDPTHSHDHGHQHAPASGPATALDQLGISSFVYKATRPFEGRKLMNLLSRWPVPVKTVLDKELLLRTGAGADQYETTGDPTTSPFVGLLRSKGFCWLAPSRWSGRNEDAWRHDTAMYWSHAGKHFAITAAGRWWGTIDREQMKQYFVNNLDECDKIIREDFVSDEFADRRQEIVFIGSSLDQDKITAALDACLLNEAQMSIYRQKLQNYQQEILSSYDPRQSPGSSSASSGLFGVGTSSHLELDQ